MTNFYCKNCGRKYSDARNLTASTCSRHPNGPNKGKHQLYEGCEKKTYTCKYCGRTYSNLMTLTASTCSRHPDGPNKGKHSPAL